MAVEGDPLQPLLQNVPSVASILAHTTEVSQRVALAAKDMRCNATLMECTAKPGPQKCTPRVPGNAAVMRLCHFTRHVDVRLPCAGKNSEALVINDGRRAVPAAAATCARASPWAAAGRWPHPCALAARPLQAGRPC